MRRRVWLDLGPGLLLGAGIVASTLVAKLAAESAGLIAAGPLLVLAVVGSSVLASRLRGGSSGPSPAALISGGACLLAGLVLTLGDPRLLDTLLPVIGAAGWVSLLPRAEGRRTMCRNI
jgi:hypothetical protein